MSTDMIILIVTLAVVMGSFGGAILRSKMNG